MLAQHFWGVDVFCPKCKKSATLQLVLFSADGELKMTYFCFGCREALEYRTFASALAHRALLNDIDAERKETKRKREERGGRPPLEPPLAVPPPAITDEDRKWEREMGIDPGED